MTYSKNKILTECSNKMSNKNCLHRKNNNNDNSHLNESDQLIIFQH
jgi:hypothetical protein